MLIKTAREVLGGGWSSWNDHHNPSDPQWRVRAAQEDAAVTQDAYWTLRALKEGLIVDALEGTDNDCLPNS